MITGESYTEGGQTQHCSHEAPGWRAQKGDQGNIIYTFPGLSFVLCIQLYTYIHFYLDTIIVLSCYTKEKDSCSEIYALKVGNAYMVVFN